MPHLAIQTCPLAAAQRLGRLTLVLSNTHRSGVCATCFWDIGPAGQQTWRSGKQPQPSAKTIITVIITVSCRVSYVSSRVRGEDEHTNCYQNWFGHQCSWKDPWAWRMTILRNCSKRPQKMACLKQPLRNKCQQNMRIPQIIKSPRVSQNRNCKGTCRIYDIF